MKIYSNTIKFAIDGVIGAPLPPIFEGLAFSQDIVMSGATQGTNPATAKGLPSGWTLTKNPDAPILTLACPNPAPFDGEVIIMEISPLEAGYIKY